MMFNNKVGQVMAGFIIIIVFIFVGLLVFSLVMPLGLPFIDMIVASDTPVLGKFLFMAIPFLLFIAIVFGTIFLGG